MPTCPRATSGREIAVGGLGAEPQGKALETAGGLDAEVDGRAAAQGLVELHHDITQRACA